MNIPSSSNSNTIPIVSQVDSNGEKESSSISSFEEYTYTKEEPEQLIETIGSSEGNATKKSKSTRRKENSNPIKTPALPTELIPPPKFPTKLQADFRPLTIPLLTKAEIPACSSVRPAQIQSVSFTAGTFGSITTTQTPTTRPHLSLNLSKKAGWSFFFSID